MHVSNAQIASKCFCHAHVVGCTFFGDKQGSMNFPRGSPPDPKVLKSPFQRSIDYHINGIHNNSFSGMLRYLLSLIGTT